MSVLITADIHLTDNPKDEYRWELLSWLEGQADELKVDHILVLGDLTDAKDHHSASLVNRLVDSFDPSGWIFLAGNHDYVDPNCPFFRFLHKIGASYILKPYDCNLTVALEEVPCLFLPATRDWRKDWEEVDFKCDQYEYIFAHATFNGSIAENGQKLSGIPPSIFDNYSGQIFAGDVHVPQIVGKVTYIGAPFHIHFGDRFSPRVLYIDDSGKSHNLYFPTLEKCKLVLSANLKLPSSLPRNGDQVKIEVNLKRAEFPLWEKLRSEIVEISNEQGWDLCGLKPVLMQEKQQVIESQPQHLSPVDLIKRFGEKNNLDDKTVKVGLELVGG